MGKRRKHRLLLMIGIAGMMLSLVGCGGKRASKTEELLKALAMNTADPLVLGATAPEQIPGPDAAGNHRSEQMQMFQIESHTQQGVQKDALNRAVDTILSADREFLGGYPLDESFLFWFRSLYGEDALEQVADEALAGRNGDIWYQISGNSIHVLWLNYCEQYDMHSEQLLRVTRQECA